MGNGKSDEPNNGFTVSGFNLREYRKKHPETYRYNTFKSKRPINFVSKEICANIRSLLSIRLSRV